MDAIALNRVCAYMGTASSISCPLCLYKSRAPAQERSNEHEEEDPFEFQLDQQDEETNGRKRKASSQSFASDTFCFTRRSDAYVRAGLQDVLFSSMHFLTRTQANQAYVSLLSRGATITDLENKSRATGCR